MKYTLRHWKLGEEEYRAEITFHNRGNKVVFVEGTSIKSVLINAAEVIEKVSL